MTQGQHLTHTGRRRPLAVDLFSGAGGMSLGFEQAGFDVVAAVEIDPVHAAVHKFNFPHCAVLPRSVVGLSAADVRLAAGIGDRPIDCVFGGPPCQGFSMIGQRALDDPRNSLVREFLRLVKDLDAQSFVFENVKGLTVGKHRDFLDQLIAEFEASGYVVSQPWKVLNAADYGVPQSRERLILMGVKRGRECPIYPEPSTQRKAVGEGNLPAAPTCKDALDDIPNADDFASLKQGDAVRTTRFKEPSPYASSMRCESDDDWHFGYRRNWDSTILTSSARTEHSLISKGRFADTPGGYVEPISRFFKLAANGVSNTLRAGTDGARGAFTSPRPIHYRYPRCITVREMARLHGFPDWFRLHATKWHGARQVGNAVPPPLARAIASSVIKALRVEPVAPPVPTDLGDPQLLNFDVTQAARYFRIPAPNTRRDSKSGAKKRKQEDIEALRRAAIGKIG